MQCIACSGVEDMADGTFSATYKGARLGCYETRSGAAAAHDKAALEDDPNASVINFSRVVSMLQFQAVLPCQEARTSVDVCESIKCPLVASDRMQAPTLFLFCLVSF